MIKDTIEGNSKSPIGAKEVLLRALVVLVMIFTSYGVSKLSLLISAIGGLEAGELRTVFFIQCLTLFLLGHRYSEISLFKLLAMSVSVGAATTFVYMLI